MKQIDLWESLGNQCLLEKKKKLQSSLSDSSSSIRLGGPSIATFGFGCFCIGCIMPLTNWYAEILGEEWISLTCL